MSNLKHNDITFPLPTGWEDATQVVALGPADGPFRPNLVISQEPLRGEGIDKFAARQLPLLKSALEQYVLVKEGPAKFGKHSGFLREHAFAVNGQKLTQLQFYIPRGQQVVTLTFTHAHAKFAAARPMAEKAFEKVAFG